MSKDPSKPLPHHRGHNPVSTDEFEIRRNFWHIKQRITNELEFWPSTIFDQEIKKLQIEQMVSKLAISTYVKPLSHYKSGSNHGEQKIKPKILRTLNISILRNHYFSTLKRLLMLYPKSFCNTIITEETIVYKYFVLKPASNICANQTASNRMVLFSNFTREFEIYCVESKFAI